MAKAKFVLDAQGTDGSDPALMIRRYWDGTEQPASEPELTNTGWDRLELLPQWATMSTQQAVDYIETNVTTLASAKVVLIALAKMVIAERDFLLSHLDQERE